MFKKICDFFSFFGCDILKLPRMFKYSIPYLRDKKEIKRQLKNNADFTIIKSFPQFFDRNASSGTFIGHYVNQDLLIAQLIFRNNPDKHVDIGSRVDGFVTHVASFREIEVFDLRPLTDNIENIKFKQMDFMDENHQLKDYCDSISCLHAIEHFGLGRYGDKIDVDGHLKGLYNIYEILKKDGYFYFSVPIGPQRIEFNAHRVFDLKYLLNIFKDKYKIKSFSYVNDDGHMFKNILLTEETIKNNFNCSFGCGIFELIKL